MACESEYQYICSLVASPPPPPMAMTPSLFTDKQTWAAARAHCQSLGGDLASIHSNATNDELYNLSRGVTTWLGLIDTAQEGVWVWSDGTPFDHSLWGVGEPDGAQFVSAACATRIKP